LKKQLDKISTIANQPNDFQGALTYHELPLFHPDTSKDTTTGCHLIERVEIAADTATWGNKRKVQELASVLRGRAQSWWDSLASFQVNKEDRLLSKPANLKLSI
jgi:hypothetical protein